MPSSLNGVPFCSAGELYTNMYMYMWNMYMYMYMHCMYSIQYMVLKRTLYILRDMSCFAISCMWCVFWQP